MLRASQVCGSGGCIRGHHRLGTDFRTSVSVISGLMRPDELLCHFSSVVVEPQECLTQAFGPVVAALICLNLLTSIGVDQPIPARRELPIICPYRVHIHYDYRLPFYPFRILTLDMASLILQIFTIAKTPHAGSYEVLVRLHGSSSSVCSQGCRCGRRSFDRARLSRPLCVITLVITRGTILSPFLQ